MKTERLSLSEIYDLSYQTLISANADHQNADAVATTITAAERDGSVSHGLFRLPGYFAALKSGKINGQASPVVVSRTPVILDCDGQSGFSPLAIQRSIPPLIAAAHQYGIAAISIRRAAHFAALWPEAEALAEKGLVGISCVSYVPVVAPAGGTQALFGTNPLCFSWPRQGKPPMVVDMATSAMAQGEIQIAAREGNDVPLGVGLDRNGLPTTDPAEILKGVQLPFGGYKGSLIAMMVELMAGSMIGETSSFRTVAADNGDGGPPLRGQFLMAISPEILSGGNWQNEAEAFFEKLSLMKGVRLPGKSRFNMRNDTGPRSIDIALLERIRGF